jgi:eukaryotic-like serine/threonine-protein kinase
MAGTGSFVDSTATSGVKSSSLAAQGTNTSGKKMALEAGTKLGSYEILDLLGAGGMGEVYRARDIRLDRTVAIKVLPAHLSSDPERRQRFEREAKTISSLNHPHICALYDIGKDAGTDYLILEYLEGESLAHRLEKGPLPAEQLLRISVEMADALAVAHRHGVTHRDLKPGNIMLTKSGAKLLDFGLAKPASLAPGSAETAMLIEAKPMTTEGTIVGTFQYMAPEQLEGKDADPRSDIFAFGAVLYEMATGKRAFEGKTQASVIAAILEREPAPISTLQPMAPPALDRVVKKCLAKDPDDRWQSAQDLRDELKWVADAGSQAGVPAPVVARRRSRERMLLGAVAGLAVLLVAALVALALATGVFRKPQPPLGAVRFQIPPPEGYAIAGPSFHRMVAVSPDGRMIAFAAADSKGNNSLWVRALDSTAAQRLENTDGAEFPFWSPDSQFIGYLADDKLMRIPVTGGSPQTVCEAKSFAYAAWGPNGVILFGQGNGPVMRVSAEGGEPSAVTEPDVKKGDSDVGPEFLPDGKHFLFLRATVGGNSVHVGSMDSHEAKLLLKNPSMARFCPPNHLLFVRDGVLMAQVFDPGRLMLTGEPLRVADGVSAANYGPSSFSVSSNGILAYRSGNTTILPTSQLTWYNRQGKKLGEVGSPGYYLQAVLSPDEKRVALQVSTDPKNLTNSADLWLLDLTNGVFSRLTFDSAGDVDPVWSPDSRQITYGLLKAQPEFMQLTLGSSQPRKLYADGQAQFLDDLSPDGKFLAYHTGDNSAFFALPMAGEQKPVKLLQSQFFKDQLHFSPDGKWVAYQSNESGRMEVYVAAFPKMDQKRQVSTNGGGEAMWRGDGKELYYLGLDGQMMAVSVKEGATIETGPPKALFPANVINPFGNYDVTAYNVSRDGQKFLLLEPVKTREAQHAEPINVIVNWDAALAK